MSNKEKWDLLTKDLPCPQSYLDFGFYFLIAAALQRRVWYYDLMYKPLFVNMYITLVGRPAVGKGLVISLIKDLLKHHKDEKGVPIKTSIGSELPLLFPMGGDTITFEKLLDAMASCTRTVRMPDGKPYIHCSYSFILSELSSLFKIQAIDVTKFLLQAFDCEDYDKGTKTQGENKLRNSCLNFIAGTQIKTLKDMALKGLLDDGFSSRTIFLFENSRRFDRFHLTQIVDELDFSVSSLVGNLSSEQYEARNGLLEWLKQLSKLAGRIYYDNTTANWLENWYVNTHCPIELRANDYMAGYFGRKKVHILKLAAAIHFSECITMEVSLEELKKALGMLNAIEPNLYAGMALSGKNELYAQTRSMLMFIQKKQAVTEQELILSYISELNLDQIKMCLKTLELGHGLRTAVINNKTAYTFE